MAITVSTQSSSSHGMPYPKKEIERTLVGFIGAAGIAGGDFTVQLGAKCKGTSHTRGVSYKGRSGPTGLCLRVHPLGASNDECYEVVLIVPPDKADEYERLFIQVREGSSVSVMTIEEIGERIKAVGQERTAIEAKLSALKEEGEKITRDINALLRRQENLIAKHGGFTEERIRLENEERVLAEKKEEINKQRLAEKRQLADGHLAAAVAEMKSAGFGTDEISARAAKLAGAA